MLDSTALHMHDSQFAWNAIMQYYLISSEKVVLLHTTLLHVYQCNKYLTDGVHLIKANS